MNSFGPQSYSTCLKRVVPSNFKMNKEAVTLMCSIIYEINLNLIKACLSRKNEAKEVTAKYVESSIRRLLPKELRASALAAGYSEIVRFQTGFIIYKEPKLPKPSNLDSKMLRKGLKQLAETSHRNLTLSKNCSTIGCIIYKLAVQITEKSLSINGDDKELLLKDMRSTVYNILGDELFNHAEGHATSNLNWYLSDTLDFTLKPLQSDGREEKKEVECELLQRYIQKLAKSQYSTSFINNGAKSVDKILKEIVNRVLEDTGNFVVNKVLQNLAVSEYVMYEVVQKLFPPVMFKMACSYAQGRVLNYSCGMLKYEYKRPVEEIEVVPVQQEVEFTVENTLPNYKNAVKRLMYEYHCTPDKGFLPLMNNILNDIGVAFAEMCSLSAQRNGSILSENDVFAAVNTLLPKGLRNHAFARIVHVGRECPPQNKQIIDMLMSTPNHAPYEFDHAFSSTDKPAQLTDGIAVPSPLEESTIDTMRKDSKEDFARHSLPLKNVSSFSRNEQSATNTADDVISPFYGYLPDKPQSAEVKRPEHSSTSISRLSELKKAIETSIEQLSRPDREHVHGDKSRSFSGVSETDTEYPECQVSISNNSADNRKQHPSVNNEVKLSNVPSIPVRASTDKAPFSDYLPGKPRITEVMNQAFEGKLPIESSIEQLSRQELESVQSDKSRRSMSVVSEIDAEYPERQVSENDISPDSRKQQPSIMNEIRISNDPTIPFRASKDFGEHFPKENCNSLGFHLPRRESVIKLDEEEIFKTLDKDILSNLPGESEMKNNKEELAHETSNIGGEKEPSEETDEISYLTQASEDSNNFEENQSNQNLPENMPDVEWGKMFDANEKEIQSRKESIRPEINNNIQSQLLNKASSSSDKKHSTPIKDKNEVLTSDLASEIGLGSNKRSSLHLNEDILLNLPAKNKNGSSDQIQQSKYSTTGELKSISANEGNRFSSFFNLLQQVSNTILYPFQDKMDTSQESLTPSKQLSDDVINKSSTENLNILPSKMLSSEYTENKDTVISKNNVMDSMETLTGSETQLKDIKHRSSLSAYVAERLDKIENEEFDNFDDTIPTNEEIFQDKLRNLYLSEEARNQKQTPRNVSKEEMRNTIFNTIQVDEISADDISIASKEKEHETIFLDIPRTIYWIDVRPYDILM